MDRDPADQRRTKASSAASDTISPVSKSRIENVNLRRIMTISIGTLAFEIINLFIPNFWKTPILWIGAIYLASVSVMFLILLACRKPAALFRKPELLNTLFWSLFIVGFFPFLVRDARLAFSPLNCVLLCTVLICAPLLRVRSLTIIFSVSTLVNLLAAWYASLGSAMPGSYLMELVAINLVGYFMARNLHGRYFSLLAEQEKLYRQQLDDRLAQEALQSRLEQDRLVNAARFEFLSRMSHDLRTPLNAVIGLSGIAMNGGQSEQELQMDLQEINTSARLLLALINDVLDVSKLESGQMTLHPEPYRVSGFLEIVRSIIGVQCEQQKIHLETAVDDGFPEYILTDRLRFNQIFLNLLSNAVKFTPEGGTISLRLSHEASGAESRDAAQAADSQAASSQAASGEAFDPAPGASGQHFLLTGVVQDSGRGMEPDFAAHAFDAFAQETAEDSEQGTGLGLAIVSKIVKLMQGTIALESTPGVGSTFTVKLPAEAAAAPASRETEKAQSEEKIRKTLNGRRVLLCEDHPLNQKVAAGLLKSAGVLTEIAANGQIGLQMFSASQPHYYDAVLMDVRMPVMDGLAAAAAIRALPRADAVSVPIIAMTANAYEEDIEKSRSAGMNAHLSKPIEPAVLYQTLAKYIK